MNRNRSTGRYGGVEAGGTKFVCAVGSNPDDVRQPENRIEIATGTNDPELVVKLACEWFRQQEARIGGELTAIGIGSFGPIDLHRSSPTYGHITTTPKTNWVNFNLVGAFSHAFPHLPIAFDTDVNAAAVGEGIWGAGRGMRNYVYITIGTGIGGAAVVNGVVVHGLLHPEMGHMILPRVAGDSFAGVCTRHGHCWEGTCSGAAIIARTGKHAFELQRDDPMWDVVIQLIGTALANLVCVLSPERIIVGGSVRKGGQLGEQEFFAKCRRATQAILGGYIVSPMIQEQIEQYIVPPSLGDDAGVCGALGMAHRLVTTTGGTS